MSADSALFIAASVGLMMAVAAWIAWPLVRGAVPADPPDARAVALLARREAALAALRDLDSDFADERLNEADYHELRSQTVAEGAAALAALDSVTEGVSGRTTKLAAAVEADVARAVGESDLPQAPARAHGAADGRRLARETDESAPARETNGRDLAGGAGESARSERFCTRCGKEARDGDLFCAGCGQAFGSSAGVDS